MTETMIIIIVAGVVLIAFGILCLAAVFRTQQEARSLNKRIVSVEKGIGNISQMVKKASEQARWRNEELLIRIQKTIESQPKPQPANAIQPAGHMPQTEQKGPEMQRRRPPQQMQPAAAAESWQTPGKSEPADFSEPEPIRGAQTGQTNQPDEITIEDLLNDFEDILPEVNDHSTEAVQEQPEPGEYERTITQINALVAGEPANQISTIKANSGIPAWAEEPADPTREADKNITGPKRIHYDYDVGKSGIKYTTSKLEVLIRE